MAALSKADYLKRYLSENAEEKKKKKRKKAHSSSSHAVKSRSRIVDDDIDLKSLLPSNLENTLEEDVGDNDPTVVDVIDERPEEIKQLERYRSTGAWKLLGDTKDNSDSSPTSRNRHDSDSDQSPPRRKRHDSDSDQSPPRRQRHDSDSDQSPTRRQRHDSDSDQSPLRRQRHDSDSDQSPPRRQRHDSDSDQSLPRKTKNKSDTKKSSKGSKGRKDNPHSDISPPRKRGKIVTEVTRRKRHDSDSDQSPPRRRKQGSDSDQSPPRRRKQGSDSDQSPPRKRRGGSDSDQSPPRRRKRESPPRKKARDSNQDKKLTLGGKKAGLSSAADMRREAEDLKRKENEAFGKISNERLGRGVATVFRDKTGRRRNLDEEREKDAEENKKKKKIVDQYEKWGKGMKQIESQTKAVQEALHETAKPLARYKDDDDLDQLLRDMDREEDPMLAFMSKKKKKAAGPAKAEKPRYKGPPPPPNRFGIMPGYRWDGVDRSNGFEKQVYAKQAENKAKSEQAYKWSIEDM